MSQKIPLFVSEEKLKYFTSINQNVSPDDLVPYIVQSQDIYLQNFLGATYYQSLKRDILAGTVTGPDQFLMDNYIGYAVLNWAMSVALPFLKYKIFNKSVLSPKSETADSITLEELKFLQSECRNTAETYSKRMVEWMVLHPGDYPLYIAPNVLDGQLPDRGNPYYDSLVTPHQPYAYKKRLGYNGNLGYYNNGMDCIECGPNSIGQYTTF
jgi:hypothetical protein